ncbi:unnamed protein product, partial [Prorocentrum cordatum]
MDIELLGRVDSTKYLSQKISIQDPQKVELDNRIKSIWRKFMALNGELTTTKYPIRTRIRRFESAITPCELYGSSWWTLTADLEQDSTETAVVEEYLRARWHTALPDEAAPSGPDAVALMRLATMSGTCGQTAVRAFRSLDAETMHNLS